MVTKICKFQHKNGYNSGCTKHITQIPAPIRGYSELTHSRVSDKFAQTDPVAMVTKNRKFQHKNGYNSGCVRHDQDTPAPGRGYSESAHLRASDKFAQTDSVAMVTKNCEFKHKIGYNSTK